MSVKKQAINKTISNNLIRLRKMYGMTKKEVAEALGVKPNTYRIWENINGKNGVKNYYLLQLAQIYGVTVDYLLEEHGTEETPVSAEAAVNCDTKDNKSVYGEQYITELSDYERLCLMQLRRLNNADRKKVNELIGSLLDEMDRINGITEEDK